MPDDSENLTLRATVIAGQRHADDYGVMTDQGITKAQVIAENSREALARYERRGGAASSWLLVREWHPSSAPAALPDRPR
jgi:hypothetical protein